MGDIREALEQGWQRQPTDPKLDRVAGSLIDALKLNVTDEPRG